jgi:hypothetical protein
LPGGGPTRVVLSSIDTSWNDVVAEQHEFPSIELADVVFKQHVIVINTSHSITGEFKKEGRFQHCFKARGAISFFPSDQPFFQRLAAPRIRRSKYAD